jgi:hypothetical protein
MTARTLLSLARFDMGYSCFPVGSAHADSVMCAVCYSAASARRLAGAQPVTVLVAGKEQSDRLEAPSALSA